MLTPEADAAPPPPDLPPLPPLPPERALHKQVRVAAPQAAVWQAWTSREGIESFMAPQAEVDARVGGAFHIHFNPFAPPGQRGADDMRFLALQPPQMFSVDWNAPPSLPAARAQRTLVVVRIVPDGPDASLVRLFHAGWGDGGEWDAALTYFDRAWDQVLGQLQQRFAAGPLDWTALLARMRAMTPDAG